MTPSGGPEASMRCTVLLPGPADEVEAYAVRDKVAAAGFTDARVVKPF